LSDLAKSCEYLTNEKLCLAVSDSEKAKASRQVRCKNDEKTACCYLCMFVLDCATPCRFLGKTENDSSPVEVEKTNTERVFVNENKIEEDKSKNTPVPCCPFCSHEMSKTRTEFKIDGWEGTNRKLGEEVLPVIVYLCPQCGKIDFMVDKKLNKN
jgi:hypothetical protein